ncbi:MAG: hypothetical protein KKA73_09440 [Chloroflexi bacterium]|nr:hypothetical protein [Chloroflexota bacterium]MBU1747900.1 hypothetical protein [Chloroflexota bacterium]
MGGNIMPFPGARAVHTRQPATESPCEQRQVTADGRVVCRKVGQGDAEVTPDLCAACPTTVIGCQHLRFTLTKHAPVPIVVRYAGGRTEVWDDIPPSMRLARGACVLRREAVNGPADCAGCALRRAIPAMIGDAAQPVVAAR